MLHKKTEGEKDRRHVEKGAIPLICALGAFQGKAVGAACFIANASVTSKGTYRASIIGLALHSLTSDPEEASEMGGDAPRENVVSALLWADLAGFFFQLLLSVKQRLNQRDKCVFTLFKKESSKKGRRGGKEQCSFLCSLQSRSWVEKKPRGHQINQVTSGNSTGRPGTGP